MKKTDRILITGAAGLVGCALVEHLQEMGYSNLITPSRSEYDLLDFLSVKNLFAKEKPDYVFHLAAAVYGIMGNMKNKGRSFLENALINTHVVEASRAFQVKKIVAMGTGAMYPYPSPGLPLTEEMVWMGKPHGAEDSYGQAKRAMFAQLEAYHEEGSLNFALVISGNLYGPHDKFDIEFGHVTPALIRKFYEAKRDKTTVSIWGNGSARRDFLYSKDMALALSIIMDKIEGPVNVASGNVHAIADIVSILAKHTDTEKCVVWDASKPNGQDHRSYDLTKLFDAGFKPQYDFENSLVSTYAWYEKNAVMARK